MSMTDPIADYLTRIRNAQSAQKNWVDIPASNMKKRISFVLKEEKFIRDFILIKDNKQDTLRLFLINIKSRINFSSFNTNEIRFFILEAGISTQFFCALCAFRIRVK